MADIATAQNPSEFIEAVRNTFRAYVPESDAWAQPNFFSINATVIGGLMWTAWNEARNGIDARLNPQTATGEYLDILAASPPLNLTRLGPTQAEGFVMATLPGLSGVPAGYQFTSADGTVYQATQYTALVSGVGSVPVRSVATGAVTNSRNNRHLSSADGTATSLGIFGGQDSESDEAFRRRIFSTQSTGAAFFGSACSYETAILAYPGVSRAWAIDGPNGPSLAFLMEGKYPCGVPLDSDIADIQSYFADECLTSLCSCLSFIPATSLTIYPQLQYVNCPDDHCEIEDALQDWLRANYDIGEGVRSCDIDAFLQAQFPDYMPTVACCDDMPPVSNAVYNCVELIGA